MQSTSDNRIEIDKIEFYITNVCNLTCAGCNRYNNYKFAGWQNYDDYAEILQKWSEKIKIKNMVILGGEPLLNPSINKWIAGLRKIWPDTSSPHIVSNGTRIDLVEGLWETCYRNESWIGISIHRRSDREAIFNRIRNYLKHPIQEGMDIRPELPGKYQFIDPFNVQVHVWDDVDFLQSSIIERLDGTRTLHKSDPIKAHSVCPQVINKNYHMINGRIYKCGPAPLMAEFDHQYPLDITDEDRALLNIDQGLGIDEFDDRGKEFFQNIDNPIPQCKFCPESYKWHPVEFTDLKPNKV